MTDNIEYDSAGYPHKSKPEPALPELLESTKDHVMTDEEKDEDVAYCRCPAPKKPNRPYSAVCSICNKEILGTGDARGRVQPDTTDLQENIDSNDRLAEGLVRGVQEMGASQAKLPVHIDGETWDVTVRFRGAQPEPVQFAEWIQLAADSWDEGQATGAIVADCTWSEWMANSLLDRLDKLRAVSSPAPSNETEVARLRGIFDEIAIMVGPELMGSHPPNCEPDHVREGVHRKLLAGVTGNEGKDGGTMVGTRDGIGDRVAENCADTTGAAPLASHAVVTRVCLYGYQWCNGTNRHICEWCIKDLQAKVSELEAQLQQAQESESEFAKVITTCHALLDRAGIPSAMRVPCDDNECNSQLVHRVKGVVAELERMRAGGKS